MKPSRGIVADYSKGIKETAKIGETIQLIERAVAPVRAGVKAAVVVSVLALLVAIAAVGVAFVGLRP